MTQYGGGCVSGEPCNMPAATPNICPIRSSPNQFIVELEKVRRRTVFQCLASGLISDIKQLRLSFSFVNLFPLDSTLVSLKY